MSVSSRRRYTAAERSDWVARFRQSGLTQRGFAAQHGLGVANLQRWVAGKFKQTPAFAEVPLPALHTPGSWAAEIVQPNGTTLRLTNAVSPTLVKQLLRRC